MPGDQTQAQDQLRLFALRGATTVEENTAGAIVEATELLVHEIMRRNAIHPGHMVSCILTATHDLDAEFPAVAARNAGLSAVPLLCAREIPVPNSMPRVIRVLLHYYAAPDHVPDHVYRGEAQKLRADLHAAQ